MHQYKVGKQKLYSSHSWSAISYTWSEISLFWKFEMFTPFLIKFTLTAREGGAALFFTLFLL